MAVYAVKMQAADFPSSGALGRAMGGLLLTAGPLAYGTVGFDPAILVRLDADLVEQGRVEFHDRILCAGGRDAFKT